MKKIKENKIKYVRCLAKEKYENRKEILSLSSMFKLRKTIQLYKKKNVKDFIAIQGVR